MTSSAACGAFTPATFRGSEVEFAVLNLGVREIIVCGHSHCGAIRALYTDPPPSRRRGRTTRLTA